MTNILLRGPYLTSSGYATHARQIARWILERSTTNDDIFLEALPWGNTPWIVDASAHNGLIGKLMQCAKPVNKQLDVSIQVQLPNEFDPKKAKFNIGVTAAIETDRCHHDWIDACNRMNAIVVPSQHAKLSLTNVGQINVPLYVIPEAFTDECVDTPKSFQDLSTDFNFLVFGQITGNNPENDRKNLFYTIKWLCEEFKNDQNVGIVLKTNAGRNNKIDRNTVVDLLVKLLSEVRTGQFPRIHLLHGSMTDEDVVSVYKNPKMKALVTLTRGEGFGLPILEASACDLPIIAPNWSGYTDFLSKGKFLKVQHIIKQIHPSRVDGRLFVENAKWCEVNGDDFKKVARKFYNASSEPKKWAVELGEKIRQSHSFSSIANIYEQTFKDVL
jgi:glycosyltransferase involved in cell wall biosynthesis